MEFFATAAKGTEPALRDELRELRLGRMHCERGGVRWEGDAETGWLACLHSRVAVRVLAVVARFPAKGGDALYDGVRAVDWSPWVTPRHTLAVRCALRSSELTHTEFVNQRVKDAIVDQLRDRGGERPSVDRKDPDFQLFLHLVHDEATLYLDLSGDSLHRRGYRALHLEAPLKETLAAACLRLAGWDRRSPLLDPMCGSGTFAIEAAMWSRNIAPGLLRPRFGFERWADFDDTAAARMADLRQRARDAVLPDGPPIRAMDVDPRAVDLTRENARLAGVEVEAHVVNIAALQPTGAPGLLVTNPPYGHRLPAEARLHATMGEAFRRFRGHTVGVLSGTPEIPQAIRMPPVKWWEVHNGDLPCRWLVYRP